MESYMSLEKIEDPNKEFGNIRSIVHNFNHLERWEKYTSRHLYHPYHDLINHLRRFDRDGYREFCEEVIIPYLKKALKDEIFPNVQKKHLKAAREERHFLSRNKKEPPLPSWFDLINDYSFSEKEIRSSLSSVGVDYLTPMEEVDLYKKFLGPKYLKNAKRISLKFLNIKDPMIDAIISNPNNPELEELELFSCAIDSHNANMRLRNNNMSDNAGHIISNDFGFNSLENLISFKIEGMDIGYPSIPEILSITKNLKHLLIDGYRYGRGYGYVMTSEDIVSYLERPMSSLEEMYFYCRSELSSMSEDFLHRFFDIVDQKKKPCLRKANLPMPSKEDAIEDIKEIFASPRFKELPEDFVVEIDYFPLEDMKELKSIAEANPYFPKAGLLHLDKKISEVGKWLSKEGSAD